ncbi:hypothetical protein G9U51_00720 [Calidifontibacter sp. DB0510]|uniref:Uncharacterized protein n=1 Tax=Metallococcus carri TaxID=1656884 RepID=A0A967AXL3_9MICO|nr:hypothetical protein [Metallococcus carri]NHN54307.1 hypothetical protein [Metallococcus carri]NOP36853.1 hypothetical protein [Calidifontibacter sp. DB2511S]
MGYSVTPDDLQRSSKALRRSATRVVSTPGQARWAFGKIEVACGDPACAGVAAALAGSWADALAALSDTALGLGGATFAAGTAYAGADGVVATAVGTAS